MKEEHLHGTIVAHVGSGVNQTCGLSLLKPIIIFNGIQAFIQRKELVKHDPFAGASHERQIELAAAHELDACELGLKDGESPWGLGRRRWRRSKENYRATSPPRR